MFEFKRTQKFIQWLSAKLLNKPLAKAWYWIYLKWMRLVVKTQTAIYRIKGVKMIKLGVVGDLSMQDPARLDRCMTEALEHCDVVVNVGDVHPGYEVMKKHLKTGKVFVVPGNHDQDYEKMGVARQWMQEYKHFVLVGIDNSEDTLDNDAWQLLHKAGKLAKEKDVFLFVVTHKPLSIVLLPNGEENHHIMGHGKRNDKGRHHCKLLREWLDKQNDVLVICGHFHSWTFQRTAYADILLEGRGGAAPELGWTQILVTKDGWSFHKVDLD